MELLKANDKNEEIVCMSGNEVEKISSIQNFNKIENTKNTETPKNPESAKGGFAIVTDPIYKLTLEEKEELEASGYNIERTGNGNYRIKNGDGKIANPLEIQTLCEFINRNKNKNKNRTGWTFAIHL